MDFSAAWAYKTLLLNGFAVTIELSILAIITGTLLGFVAGLSQTSKWAILKYPTKLYIEIFRGSPLLIQLFMVFYGLPYLGIDISIFAATLLVFTLYGGAYIAEIIRSGIESIPKGQFEASQSLGLTYRQMMQKIILPQTLKVSLPPLMGFYIGLIKDTSVASIIGYMEVVKEGQMIINITAKPFEIYFVISVMYFIISYPLSLLVDWIEGRNKHA
ncbi:amino acid ABC transporter permease [Ferviditalea candida]|uniref:Amino acid ABC transporter permease n=1 Tax=Ferviditalea candida TaxID=3108399 RepID=A0ABU5ZFJ1_9BACL|nr:amino acid ABC transporter permease [Paenibacillaceae bacterium T2]